PFDRTRPLWQFVVVDGLKGGRGALIEKMHHTIADGEASVRMSMQFLDIARDAPEPPPIEVDAEDAPEPPPPPTPADTVRDLFTGSLRMPIGMIRQVRDLLADPTQIPSAGMTLAE